MALAVGSRSAHYDVPALIGEGGIGWGRCIAHETPSSIGTWRSRCCPTHSPPTLTVDVAVRIFIVASPSKVVGAVRTRCGQIRHALMIHGSHLTERRTRDDRTGVMSVPPRLVLGLPQGVARRQRRRRKTIAAFRRIPAGTVVHNSPRNGVLDLP